MNLLLKSVCSSSRTSMQGNCFLLLLWFPDFSYSLLYENLCTVLNHCLANIFQEKNYDSLFFTISANYQSQVMLHLVESCCTTIHFYLFFCPRASTYVNCCQIICVQMMNTLLPSSVLLPTLREFQYEKVYVLFVHVIAVSMMLVQLHLRPTCRTWET